MDILYEALMDYLYEINSDIEYFEETDDFSKSIIINKLIELRFLQKNINNFMTKVIKNLDDNILDLHVVVRNNYYKEFNISRDYALCINKKIRTIKNRFYQRTARIKKLKVMHN